MSLQIGDHDGREFPATTCYIVRVKDVGEKRLVSVHDLSRALGIKHYRLSEAINPYGIVDESLDKMEQDGLAIAAEDIIDALEAV